MTYKEARKEIIEDGINLGAGDFVSVEALKVAAEALERVDNLRAERIEGAKEFAFYLIEHAKKGKIRINDLPDLLKDWSDAYD